MPDALQYLPMEFKITKQPKSLVVLKISVSPEDMKKAREQALERLGSQVAVPGFRKGHVPTNIVLQHVKPETVYATTLDIVIPTAYAEAVMKEKLQVVARPKVKIIKDDPLEFEAEVAVMPEIKLKNLKKIKIPHEEVKITEKDIQKVLEELRKRGVKETVVDRATKKGDKVEIDFTGKDKTGVVLEGMQSKNHPLILGEGVFLPQFEENLLGVKKGDKKEFTLTFPEDYHVKKYQKKEVTFTVDIHTVTQRDLPELNDAFCVENFGENHTVEKVQKLIKEDLEKQRAKEAQEKRENVLLEKIVESTEVDLPEDLINEEIDFLYGQQLSEIERMGITREQYEKYLAEKKKDPKAELRERAIKQVTLRMALIEIIKEEKLTVTDEEVQAEKEVVLQQYGVERPKAEESFAKDANLTTQLKNKVLLRKLFAYFLN